MFDVIFKAIFFLVRIPIFLLGVFIWSFIAPFMICYALLVVPLLGLPFAFLSGVFSNSPKEFTEKLGDVFEAMGSILDGAFGPYASMFFWLLGIKYRRGRWYISLVHNHATFSGRERCSS